ncbi:uncharacterized protein LOC131675259 [Phymastichus coffea]|uniref:uncharacterized protein LOC131675259 n=1 Tax=Phymastichus coffea TaxID=108790 RepID=UPI00273BC32B|nr:uncharacterized protein LOC131675259 [Phymastichus coffea]
MIPLNLRVKILEEISNGKKPSRSNLTKIYNDMTKYNFHLHMVAQRVIDAELTKHLIVLFDCKPLKIELTKLPLHNEESMQKIINIPESRVLSHIQSKLQTQKKIREITSSKEQQPAALNLVHIEPDEFATVNVNKLVDIVQDKETPEINLEISYPQTVDLQKTKDESLNNLHKSPTFQ